MNETLHTSYNLRNIRGFVWEKFLGGKPCPALLNLAIQR